MACGWVVRLSALSAIFLLMVVVLNSIQSTENAFGTTSILITEGFDAKYYPGRNSNLSRHSR